MVDGLLNQLAKGMHHVVFGGQNLACYNFKIFCWNSQLFFLTEILTFGLWTTRFLWQNSNGKRDFEQYDYKH